MPSGSLVFGVSIPASSANLGPGFDVLGLALDLHLRVSARLSKTNRIKWNGEGSNEIPTDQANLLLRAASQVAPDSCFDLQVHNQIPIGRGLGSSAASIVGGLLAAARLGRRQLTKDELLELALPLEGHLDNISASIHGGLVLVTTGSPPQIRQLRWPPKWRIVLFIPDRFSPTQQLRDLVPARIPREDAIFNLGRIGEWVLAVRDLDPSRLARAMEDRIHQPYRSAAYPYLDDVIKMARKAGAFGASLSGAGGSVIAIVERDRMTEAGVGKAMLEGAREHGEAGRILVADADNHGARFAHD